MVAKLMEPTVEQVLDFCADEPVERVFLEDVARSGLGRFRGLSDGGRLAALCHFGVNVVPSGRGCAAFGSLVADGRPRMLIGEERAVSDLWEAAGPQAPRAREDRRGQPVYLIDDPPRAGETALRPATRTDLPILLPACAAAHEHELGVNPLDADAFRLRTTEQIDHGRSWIWTEDGVILFKAEASAWTARAVQLQQVWVDPAVRGRGLAKRALADLCRLLLRRVPVVCLFVRAENAAAIALYDSVGMRRVLTYRSVLF